MSPVDRKIRYIHHTRHCDLEQVIDRGTTFPLTFDAAGPAPIVDLPPVGIPPRSPLATCRSLHRYVGLHVSGPSRDARDSIVSGLSLTRSRVPMPQSSSLTPCKIQREQHGSHSPSRSPTPQPTRRNAKIDSIPFSRHKTLPGAIQGFRREVASGKCEP